MVKKIELLRLNWTYSINGDIAWPARFLDLSVPTFFGGTLKLMYVQTDVTCLESLESPSGMKLEPLINSCLNNFSLFMIMTVKKHCIPVRAIANGNFLNIKSIFKWHFIPDCA